MMATPLAVGCVWWDSSWNVLGGCTAVSSGCRHCYAAREAATRQTACRVALYEDTTTWVRGVRPVFNGRLTILPPEHPAWSWPLTWPGSDAPLLGSGQPSLIFVSDMSDVFHEQRPREVIDQVVATLVASRHIGLLLTKRPAVMAEYFAGPGQQRRKQKLWLGFSAETQEWFDRRWEHMRELAANGWTVFVSIAPMLGPVRLPPDFFQYGSWVIVSGEQGPAAVVRHMDPDWARAVRDQCAAAGVPFFMLQMSGQKVIPADLFVRQFPGG
jgi:protein gp37